MLSCNHTLSRDYIHRYIQPETTIVLDTTAPMCKLSLFFFWILSKSDRSCWPRGSQRLCWLLWTIYRIISRKHISMGLCKKVVTPLLTHWSYVFLALTAGVKRHNWHNGLASIMHHYITYNNRNGLSIEPLISHFSEIFNKVGLFTVGEMPF